MIEWINSVEDPSAFASKSQLAPNYSSLHHNVEMEQLNLSDAIDLHPEITVNTSCQRMETVDQEKGTAAPSIKDDRLWSWRFSFSWIDSTWLSRLAGIDLNFEKKLRRLAGIDSKWLSRLAHVHAAQCNHHHLPLCKIPILFFEAEAGRRFCFVRSGFPSPVRIWKVPQSSFSAFIFFN
jgi:hypothetical protein